MAGGKPCRSRGRPSAPTRGNQMRGRRKPGVRAVATDERGDFEQTGARGSPSHRHAYRVYERSRFHTAGIGRHTECPLQGHRIEARDLEKRRIDGPKVTGHPVHHESAAHGPFVVFELIVEKVTAE